MIEFVISQEKEIKEFIADNGYVVVNDIFSDKDCEDTMMEANRLMKKR